MEQSVREGKCTVATRKDTADTSVSLRQDEEMAASGGASRFGPGAVGPIVGRPKSFRYTFPFISPHGIRTEHPIYGLDLPGEQIRSMSIVSIRSSVELGKRDAYKKLSVALALLGIYEAVGVFERVPAGIGGFMSGPSDEEPLEPVYSPEVSSAIYQLEQANSPYQIQACFTLSRAWGMVADPESAIIEFFKVIELYIKQTAFNGILDENTAQEVLMESGSS